MQVIAYDPIIKGYMLVEYASEVEPNYPDFYERRIKILKDFTLLHEEQDGFRLASLNDLIRWIEGEKHVD
jgi:hypothetical protein